MVAGALEVIMSANIARLVKDMAEAKGTVERSMKGVESAVSTAKSALAALGVGLSVGYFVSLVKGSIDAMDRLNDLSKTTDITVEKLAGLQLAAKQSGGDLESIATSINKLSQNIGKDTDKFAALGVSAKDPLEAFKQLSDVFVTIQDPQQRAAVMTEALGKSWAGAAPLLSEGSAKIQELVDKGTRLSGMTKDAAENADKFNDQMAELNTTLGATKTKLITDMLPGMNEISKAMQEAAKEGGLLLTVWVGLGGVMANILGVTDAQRTRDRLREINDQLAIAAKQLESGTLKPKGASSSLFGFLIPDVKLGETALAKIRETRAALERERATLTPPDKVTPPGVDPAIAAAAAARAAAFLKEAKAVADVENPYRQLMADLQKKLLLDKESTVVDELIVTLTNMKADAYAKLTIEQLVNLEATARDVDLKNRAKVADKEFVDELERRKIEQKELNEALVAERSIRDGGVQSIERAISQIEFETKALGMSTDERIRATAARDLEAAGIGKLDAAYEGLLIRMTLAAVNQSALKEAIAAQKDATNEITEFWRSAAQSMQRSMSDLFFDVLEGKTSDFAAKFASTINRMVADNLSAQFNTALFGKDFGKGGEIGGFIGKALSSFGVGNRAPVSDPVLSKFGEGTAAAAFASAVTAAGSTFTAEVTAAGAAFAPEITAAAVAFAPEILAAGVAFAPEIIGAGAAFSAEIMAAGASFSASVAAGSAASGAVSGGADIVGSMFDFFGDFAGGGSFMVGGSGGTDSQLVAFRASPNERVSVETPGQAGGGTQVDARTYMTLNNPTSESIPLIASVLREHEKRIADLARSDDYRRAGSSRRLS